MSDLLPCPYCGSVDLKIANSPKQVWCKAPGCHNRGPKLNDNPTEAEAIAAWNARAPRWIPSIEDLEFVIDGATFEGMKPELAHHYAKCVHAYLEKHNGGPA